MKATWTGYVTLGHLGFPVRLYSATKKSRPGFTQLHEDDLSPIELVPFCRSEHKAISSDDIVRGVKQDDGSYITLSDQDLEQVAGNRAKTVQIQQFCSLTEIDPMYYQKPYYLVPDKGGERAYSLIREVLARTGKVAIAQFVLHGKEHIAAIRPYDSVLVLHQLRFSQELIPRSDIKTPPLRKPTLTELEAGTAIVTRLSGPFFAEDYHDEQADRILEMLERKRKGLPARKRQRRPPVTTGEQDLLDALRRNLDEPEPPSLPA